MNPSDKSFAYLAFDDETGVLLAHASKAIEALDQADRIAPKNKIRVVRTENFGLSIWKCNLTLNMTCQIMDYFGKNSKPKFTALEPIQANWANLQNRLEIANVPLQKFASASEAAGRELRNQEDTR